MAMAALNRGGKYLQTKASAIAINIQTVTTVPIGMNTMVVQLL